MRALMADQAVHGTIEPGFESVRASFERGLEKGELGASACAYVDGRKVVDLWGGWADAGRTREWNHDTIVCTYSAVKGMTATCAHHLVDRGLLDVDERVATYWPEFGHAGKQDVTVRMVLSHQAGRPRARGVPAGKRFDWPAVTAGLAAGRPRWEPGTRSEYHGGEFGYLVGEVVRRIDGRPLPTYFREEIAEPLGADVLMAVGVDDDHRCAEGVGPDDMVGPVHTREWRAAADGAATGFASASGLARVYAALACGGELDGVRLLRPETIARAGEEQPLARAEGMVADFGLGYQLLWKMYPGLGDRTFGHTGMGGSIGLADPTRRIGFGFVMNQMGSNGATHLLTALYRSLA
jgi:CubicO group peptidase (beta-lactamase class C family)